jgi:kynurenine formamidase
MTNSTEELSYDTVLERDGVKVSKSPWGPADEIGRLNWLTPSTMQAILEQLDGRKVYDLSVDYFIGMPSVVAAGDPAFEIWMTHTPRGSVNHHPWFKDDAGGREVHRKYSHSGDSISLYTHCGTHIDTLNHIGHCGHFWNGWTEETHLSGRHWLVGGTDKYPPLIARGVLLDVAGLHGVETLPALYVITPDDLRNCAREQGTELRRGDIVLVRMGQMAKWPGQEYLDNEPGIGLKAAKYLCEDVGAMCVASDSLSFEALVLGDPEKPPEVFAPVHAYMFATAGCPIMEIVKMDELADDKLYEFAFLSFPMKIRGATGAPMHPIAVPLRG